MTCDKCGKKGHLAYRCHTESGKKKVDKPKDCEKEKATWSSNEELVNYVSTPFDGDIL